MSRYVNLRQVTLSKKKKSSRRRRINWFRRLSIKKRLALVVVPIVLFLILTPIITYFVYSRDISDQERLMNRNNTGIVLTDVKGKTFYSIGRAEHRKLVPLSDISDDMEHALIAGEDKDFYKHGGFNVASIARAILTNISAGDLNAYGGSTLTQQLAKNTLLSDNKSFLRKYQELAISVAIEQNYSKDQILDMYLNSVYYGENAFGIEEAAHAYFNKQPKDLSLAESAMLVGILPAPSAYSPISGSQTYAKQRQATILSRMVTNGYISEAQKTAALAEDLQYGTGAEADNTIAPHFSEMVINELSNKYGYETVMRSGYQVKTTLDLDIQQILTDNVNAAMPHINSQNGSNASGIVIDPKTGEIRALVGSADYNNDQWGKVNMVTSPRQPGSSFKPIYYSFALADGVVTPATILHDKETNFGDNYIPSNADKKFRGDISLRRAISQSLNIPSIEVMQKYGITKSVEAANKLGITSVGKDKQYGLSLALGSAEASLEQMTNAYAAFANQGRQFTPALIYQINDKFNKKVAWSSPAATQVINKEGAYLISSVLSDNDARVPIFGSSLTVSGHTVAVKTGTTNDNRDAWTIGYNPQYAIGVWVGNNDNSAMYSGGSDMAGPIWRNTMKRLLSGQQNIEFTMPANIVQRATCFSNGGLASAAGNGTYNEYYMAGALPTETCDPVPVMIDVCNLDTNKIESIDEKKFDSTKYSKNIDDCKPKKLQVCELASGKLISIDETDFDTKKYSKNTSTCASVPGGNDNGNTTTPIEP